MPSGAPTRCATTRARTCSTGRCATSSASTARQAGSLVTPDYLRFDFPFDRALTDDEKRAIEDEVRGVVREDRPVTRRVPADGRGHRAGGGRVLRREVRRDGAHHPGRGLQLRAVRRHALPGDGPDRWLRHHRRAEHRLGDAPHRGPDRGRARTASTRDRLRARWNGVPAAVGAQTVDAIAGPHRGAPGGAARDEAAAQGGRPDRPAAAGRAGRPGRGDRARRPARGRRRCRTRSMEALKAAAKDVRARPRHRG